MVMKWLLRTDFQTSMAFVACWTFVASYVLLLYERPVDTSRLNGHGGFTSFEHCVYRCVGPKCVPA